MTAISAQHRYQTKTKIPIPGDQYAKVTVLAYRPCHGIA